MAQFDINSFKRDWRKLAKRNGLDPVTGERDLSVSVYEVANAKAEQQKAIHDTRQAASIEGFAASHGWNDERRETMSAPDWWRQGELWVEREGYSAGCDRPISDEVFDNLAYLTNPRLKRPETEDEQTERLHKQWIAENQPHRVALKQILNRRGLELVQLNLAVPGSDPILMPALLPIDPALKRTAASQMADYEPLDIFSRPKRKRTWKDRKRSWKDGEVVTDTFR